MKGCYVQSEVGRSSVTPSPFRYTPDPWTGSLIDLSEGRGQCNVYWCGTRTRAYVHAEKNFRGRGGEVCMAGNIGGGIESCVSVSRPWDPEGPVAISLESLISLASASVTESDRPDRLSGPRPQHQLGGQAAVPLPCGVLATHTPSPLLVRLPSPNIFVRPTRLPSNSCPTWSLFGIL